MRRFYMAAVALVFAAVLSVSANDYASYFTNLPVELKQVASPAIPSNTVSIIDFGGVGDGLTLNTDAFAKAISALSKQGGGRLNVPTGVWLTGPIQLKDNIELHLDKNAILYFSPDKRLFIDKDGKSKRAEPCIKASKRKNVAITGQGIIDGNGAQWRPVKRGKVSDTEWKQFEQIGGVERQNGNLWYPWNVKAGYANIADTPEAQEAMRNDLIRFTNCENILIEGVTVQNSPRFHVHPVNCRNVIIDGITVRCPWNAQNGDGIDLSDCQQAIIVNSTVDVGDDGLCMKSGSYKETNIVNGCEDILIQDNTVFHAHGGFVIGSEAVCGMKRIVVRQCRFSGTDTGLRFKSAIGRGGKTENIHINDIVMTDIKNEAIVFECTYEDKKAGYAGKTDKDVKLENIPEFTNITISHIVCRGAMVGVSAHGIEGQNCVHDIALKNSTIVYSKQAEDIDAKTARIDYESVKMVKER